MCRERREDWSEGEKVVRYGREGMRVGEARDEEDEEDDRLLGCEDLVGGSRGEAAAGVAVAKPTPLMAPPGLEVAAAEEDDDDA